MNREEDKDLANFCFILDKMERDNEGFDKIELDEEALNFMQLAAEEKKGKYPSMFRR